MDKSWSVKSRHKLNFRTKWKVEIVYNTITLNLTRTNNYVIDATSKARFERKLKIFAIQNISVRWTIRVGTDFQSIEYQNTNFHVELIFSMSAILSDTISRIEEKSQQEVLHRSDEVEVDRTEIVFMVTWYPCWCFHQVFISRLLTCFGTF